MAVSIILERKHFFKELYEHSAYKKNTTSLKSVQYGKNAAETREVYNSAYSFVAKGKKKNVRGDSNVPFSRLGTETLSFSHRKLPWFVLSRDWNSQTQRADLDELCGTIVSALNESGAECGFVKCTQFREQEETFSYPVKKIDSSGYYDFSIEYQSLGMFHHYNLKTSGFPRGVDEIANIRYLMHLDSLELPIRTDKVAASSMILAPNALTNILSYLLWNKDNYQKKRKLRYFDEKLTIFSDPYHPCHASTEKTVDGRKARAVTLVKNGVLLHLPLNLEESKKAGQKYVPNAFKSFELNGGSTPLKAIIEGSGNALFIYELRGDIGDDGSFSGSIKNGFLLKDGKFTERLVNAPIFFYIPYIYNHINELSSESVSLGYLLAPYIKFNI